MKSSNRLPVLFIGHGSPMNAIDDNNYTRMLKALGEKLPRPKAVLCVSAHWMTEGTWITHIKNPKTIHDFYGFPEALFQVQYPAPSDPDLAKSIQAQIPDPKINLDSEMWGFDHGTWSVLRHLYPKADIPVLQLSLYMEQPPDYHFKIGEQLRKLREQGVLIIGSGNIVHNLRKISWDPHAQAFDWALEFDQWVKEKLEARDFKALIEKSTSFEAGKLSIPTNDHWYPIYYILGASDSQDKLHFEFEEMQNASISMRSFSLS
jgi:4,5-DOPA dioxygenase extradiol